MIKNYIKVAMRYLLRNKGYTAINILGLAIGITSCILIMLFVRSEWSYDKFHSKADRIHRVWLQEIYEGQTFTNTITPLPLGHTLQANIPDIEASCRVTNFNTFVQNNGNRFNESINLVDSNFFDVFDFGLEEGDRGNVFPNSNTIVISKELARKYFGKEHAIGKNLELQLGTEKFLFTVSAVAKKVPQESSIHFDMLIPHSNDKYLFSERARTRGWTSVFGETYVLLKHGIHSAALNQNSRALSKKLQVIIIKKGNIICICNRSQIFI